jgi:hypothetical protein
MIMKILISSILLLFSSLFTNAQQQQEVIRLDSCKQFGTTPFEEVYVRVQQTATWKNKKINLDDHLDHFFKDYVQKRAGGKITLSLLINKEGKVCTYEARPNTNVRPNFNDLKLWMNQNDWNPALQNGQPVTSIKILQISFNGKKINVTELE